MALLTVQAVQGVQVVHSALAVQDESAAQHSRRLGGSAGAGCEHSCMAGWEGLAGWLAGLPPGLPFGTPLLLHPALLLPLAPAPASNPCVASPLIHLVVGRARAPPDVGLAVGLAHHALVPGGQKGKEVGC